jgi:hypothetical protein
MIHFKIGPMILEVLAPEKALVENKKITNIQRTTHNHGINSDRTYFFLTIGTNSESLDV